MKLLIKLRALFCFVVILGSPLSWAACKIETGSSQSILIGLPATTLTKPTHSMAGLVLWESGWVSGSKIDRITCDNNGESTLGFVNGTNVPGYTDIFSFALIPGIGYRIYFCKDASCAAPPAGAYGGKAMTKAIEYEVSIGRGPFSPTPKYWLQLVTTGTGEISSGIYSFVAPYVASNSYAYNDISRLDITATSLVIKDLGCRVSQNNVNMTVFMPDIGVDGFSNTKPVPDDNSLARAFSINLTCDKGVLASYQLDGAQAVTNVLANASGANMATGVGVQLYKGDTSSSIVQPLATKTKINTVKTGNDNQLLTIPLTAKYYRTAANTSGIKGGRVSAIATLTLYYE